MVGEEHAALVVLIKVIESVNAIAGVIGSVKTGVFGVVEEAQGIGDLLKAVEVVEDV